MMGDGFAIESIDGAIFAPVSGKVTTIFPSKHALGIKTSNGVEVLVHMGIDTVNLNGAGFDVLVKVGDQVTVDTKIAQMDLPYIHSQGEKEHGHRCDHEHGSCVEILRGTKPRRAAPSWSALGTCLVEWVK